jgi:signal transduction histidine kinase
MKAVVKFGKLFHPKFHKVKVVNTFDDALRLIATHKYGKSFFDKASVQEKDTHIELSAEEEVIILREEMKEMKALQQKKLDKLFRYISNIMWDESNESLLKEAEGDSVFSDVFGAVNMLKTDISELSLERENTIRNLQGQLKKYIKELRKSKNDLQRVLSDKDDFIQALNHELRTPLQSINSTIELLKLASDKNEESRLIELINKSSKLLNKKITQIKSVSDLNLGKRELSSSIFNISKIIQNQIDVHESVIQAKQLTLRFIHDENIPSYLMGDIDKINQVLDHFIDNAIKYTNEGTITIRTKLIENLETQLVLRLEVEDTGIGVSQSVQEHLFDDMSLVKPDIGRNSHIGLGLFICKQLVEMMGGDIGYRSTENEGSCFYFVLTLNRGSFFKELNLLSRAKSLKGLSSIFLEKKEILFLEEDESKRDIIQLMFEKLGIDITFANNQEHLTSLSSKGIYSMVFLDSIAPMNVCTNILSKIRELEIVKDTEKRMPIIAITANPDESYIEECLNSGFNEVLVKPYTLSDVKKVLVKYID